MNQRPPLPDSPGESSAAGTTTDVVEVMRRLMRAHGREEVVDIVRHEARRLSAADGAALVLLEGETCHYVDEDALMPLWKGQRFRKDGCVSGWAISGGQPIAIPDIHSDPRVPADAYRGTFVRSLLVVPMGWPEPIGAVGCYWAIAHDPGEAQIRLLQLLADCAAVALGRIGHQSGLEGRLDAALEALERERAQRLRLQALLHESTERFAGVVESAMDAIISIDARQRIVFFNAAAEAMFGYSTAQMVGKPIDRLIPAPLRAAHGAHVRRFLASGATSRVMGALQPLQGLRAGGEVFPIEASISKVNLASGTLATVIVRDISRRVEAEAALAESEARLRYVTEAAEVGYWDWDLSAARLEWSAQCKAIFGIPADEPVSYARYLLALHPDDRARVDAALRTALAGHGDYDVEYRVRLPDGRVRWVHSKGGTSFAADGRALRMGGVAMDITERKKMETALRESEARFRDMADTAPAMLWVTEADGACSFLSRGWYEFTGQTERTGLGYGWLDAVHPADRDAAARAFHDATAQGLPFAHEHRLRCADQGYRWVLDTGRPRYAADGRFLGYIGSVIDITERKQAEELMRQRSLHDPLTGLPNRALTLEFAERLLAGSRRSGSLAAVLFIDLDRFKPINDTYGHHVGDIILKEVADRLRRSVRSEDVVGRQGGDEFLVILARLRTPEEAAQAATHILARLSAPYRIRLPNAAAALDLETSPSIGISLFPKDGEGIDTLIENADAAMYRAKAAGCGTFRFFTE